MSAELVVLLGGRNVGRVTQSPRGELAFTYDTRWRDLHDAYPLSVSMLMTRGTHGDAAIRPWLEGLLPDNDAVLKRWRMRYQVSERNLMGLLAHVGEDCAGAVQLITPEWMAGGFAAADPLVEWLSDAEIGARLADLRTTGAGERYGDDPGAFSLAGAQPKTALLFQDGRWGVPSGRVPTTHILKPPSGPFDGLAENEHLCQRLASGVGLTAAYSEVRRFGEEAAIVVERYDRLRVGGQWLRIHQEDLAQALGTSPRIKYEAEGGPGVGAIAGVLRRHSSSADEDLSSFVGALALNWAIGGTDGHAKNFSLLIAPGQVRLAPLYDVISVLPYPRLVPPRRARLAMRVGREYALWKIGRMHWERLGEEIGIGSEAAVERVRSILVQIPDAISAAVAGARRDEIEHPILDTLQTTVTAHAITCLRRLESSGNADEASF